MLDYPVQDAIVYLKYIKCIPGAILTICPTWWLQQLTCHLVKPFDQVVLGTTLNCIHIFIVTGSFLYWWNCVMCHVKWGRPVSVSSYTSSCIYLRILIYLIMFLGTNSLSVLMCRKEVNQSIKTFDQQAANVTKSHERNWSSEKEPSRSQDRLLAWNSLPSDFPKQSYIFPAAHD